MSRFFPSGRFGRTLACVLVLSAAPARASTDCPVLALDGVTGHATAAASIYPSSTAVSSFTVEAWFNPAQLPAPHAAATIVSDDVYDLELVNLAGVPAVRLTVWNQNAIPNQAFLEFGYGGLAVKQWNHVALVFDAAARQARVFINGVPGATRPVALSYFGVFGNVFVIGAYPAASSFLAGYVDEVRISNTARYDAGFTPPPSLTADDRTVALFQFGDAAGSAALASSPGAAHQLTTAGGAEVVAAGGCAPALVQAWTDMIGSGITIIRRVHIEELRQRIDAVRATRGLGSFPWTDAMLVHVKAVHLQELRTALAQAYAAALRAAPGYTDEPLVAGATVIKGVHLRELRAAVEALEQ